MSDIAIKNPPKLDNKIETTSSKIGKRAVFAWTNREKDKVFNFSSKLEKIGIIFDRQLKNYSDVIVLSDEEIGNHPTEGQIIVIKVFNMQSMWIPIKSLLIIDDDQ